MEKSNFELELEDSANRIVEETFGEDFAREYIELKNRVETEGE